MEKFPNRADRRKAEADGAMTEQRFLKLADRFIDLANRENRDTRATDLHMAFLYASARYSAHVGKNVLAVEEHERFVEDMLKAYAEMLRNHLADPNL
jgi:hypothetical protein